MGPLAFGVGVGFGLAAWVQRPVIVDQHSGAFVIMVLFALWAAYRGGMARQRGQYTAAVAVADADANATAAAVQSVTINLEDGGRATAAADKTLLIEDAEWRATRSLSDERAELLGDRADRRDVVQDEPDEAEPATPNA